MTVHQQTDAGGTHNTAAGLILANGLCNGNYWPDAETQNWRPGLPLCLAGAIGVAAGHNTHYHISQMIVAEDSEPHEIHPDVVALQRHLDLDTAEALFAWSDARFAEGYAGVEKAVAALRACAAEQRQVAA